MTAKLTFLFVCVLSCWLVYMLAHDVGYLITQTFLGPPMPVLVESDLLPNDVVFTSDRNCQDKIEVEREKHANGHVSYWVPVKFPNGPIGEFLHPDIVLYACYGDGTSQREIKIDYGRMRRR